MKGYVCQVCGFISINGKAPEKCPVCGAPKTSFMEKEDAIKTPLDPNNLTDPEKKHVPVILVKKECGLIPEGCMDVNVKIGQIIHPMEDKHSITRIDLYLDKEYISRVMFTPNKLNPAAGLHLKVSKGKLSVVELCNLHGAWISEVNL